MTSQAAWSTPGNDFSFGLAPGNVDIWRAGLDRSPESIEGLLDILSPGERKRAERFRFPVHRDRFIVSRGILREILSCYLDIAPREIRFAYNMYGKPRIKDPCRKNDIRFNLSHSHSTAFYAISRGREVGMDVEYTNRTCSAAKIAARFFTPNEARAIEETPENERGKAFFTCWTRKEAFLKARGCGLSMSPRSFEVTVHPLDPPALVYAEGDEAARFRWTIFAVDAGTDYVAALAVEGKVSVIRYLEAVCERKPPFARSPGKAKQPARQQQIKNG